MDWAVEVARLLEGRSRKCSALTLVCDKLTMHTMGVFYEAFPPARARALVRRLRFCHTPKHGSRLNIAENGLSSLTRQRVSGRRFGQLKTLQPELASWSADANTFQRGVDWQMTIRDACGKLKSLYRSPDQQTRRSFDGQYLREIRTLFRLPRKLENRRRVAF